MADEHVLMPQVVALDYRILSSPTQQRFDDAMREGRITGHRCPSCKRVYTPPKGFSALCTVQTSSDDEVAVADRGIVVAFTVLTPIQYQGQKERKPYALATLLLDGADATVGQQRVGGLPLDDIRMGMRVEAVWLPEDERKREISAMAQWSLGRAIKHWIPTGEPDAEREHYQEHVL